MYLVWGRGSHGVLPHTTTSDHHPNAQGAVKRAVMVPRFLTLIVVETARTTRTDRQIHRGFVSVTNDWFANRKGRHDEHATLIMSRHRL